MTFLLDLNPEPDAEKWSDIRYISIRDAMH